MAEKDKQTADQPEEKQTAQQPKKRLDHAPEGGRYLVNGRLVDANNQPVASPDQAPAKPAGNGG